MNSYAAPINAAKYKMNATARKLASAKPEKNGLVGAAKSEKKDLVGAAKPEKMSVSKAAKENIISENQAKAGAKLVKAADKRLGTAIDLKA